jgi:hypothetical protein
MKILIAQPPNLAEIDRVFPNRGAGVIFAFGDTIYNPSGAKIPRSLLAHEGAHGNRQVSVIGVERWWRMYLDDPEFRYREEVIGHAAEYLAQVNGHYDRNANARLLMTTAVRLLASFYQYGNRYTHKQAVNDLRQEAHRMSK